MSRTASTGCNLRRALIEWAELGGEIREAVGTGEFVLSSPLLGRRRARINRRRKDCGREVTVMIRRLREALARSS